MRPFSIYPVLICENVSELAQFYCEHFEFEPVYTSDWYVSLRHKKTPAYEVAMLRFDHPSMPEGHRVRGKCLINIETDDAAAAYGELVEQGSQTPVLPLRDEPWGQRHFILADPAGNLVDIIEEIEPSPEYAAAYA